MNLQDLYLDRNDFSGTISERIGDMTGLLDLRLYENRFSGALPSTPGFCEDLEILLIENTNITGTLPQEVCALTAKNLFSIEYAALRADCYSGDVNVAPFIECDCCDTCCDHVTHECHKIIT
mmetsp:Transcript_4978/g.10240  ORF Transcript_4978/g.10240 Transcript_4978/m.10240 type:complete len:122 (+) Transcript_4978:740-1105(+)